LEVILTLLGAIIGYLLGKVDLIDKWREARDRNVQALNFDIRKVGKNILNIFRKDELIIAIAWSGIIGGSKYAYPVASGGEIKALKYALPVLSQKYKGTYINLIFEELFGENQEHLLYKNLILFGGPMGNKLTYRIMMDNVIFENLPATFGYILNQKFDTKEFDNPTIYHSKSPFQPIVGTKVEEGKIVYDCGTIINIPSKGNRKNRIVIVAGSRKEGVVLAAKYLFTEKVNEIDINFKKIRNNKNYAYQVILGSKVTRNEILDGSEELLSSFEFEIKW